MAELTTTGVRLHLRMSRLEKLGALRRDLSFPLASVTSIIYADAVRTLVRGVRVPGTGVPGLILLGTFRKLGRRTFSAAYRNDAGYVVELRGADYDRLVVSMPRNPSLDGLGASLRSDRCADVVEDATTGLPKAT